MSTFSALQLRTREVTAGKTAEEVLIHLRGPRTLATIRFSARCELNQRTVTLTGSRGVARLDILANAATLHRIPDGTLTRVLGRELRGVAGTVLQAIPDRAIYALDRLRGVSSHTLLIDAFDRALHGRGEPPTPLDEIDYVVRNCDAIGRSIDQQLV